MCVVTDKIGLRNGERGGGVSGEVLVWGRGGVYCAGHKVDTGVLRTPDTRDYVSAKLHGLSFSVSAPILAPLHTWPGCLPGLFVPVTSRSLSQMLTREKTRDTETPRGWCCYSPRPGQESWRVAGASQSS